MFNIQFSPQVLLLINHDDIRTWMQKYNSKPGHKVGTASPGNVGILKILFPNFNSNKYEVIPWEAFFDKFEEKELALKIFYSGMKPIVGITARKKSH